MVVVYANALFNAFVWDDRYIITENTLAKSWRNIPTFFTTHLFEGSKQPSNSYRPLQKLSNLLDYSIWRLNPFGYHLTNIILHALNAVLIYILVNLLFKKKEISLIVSALFAIHPIHTQAVTYISGRADLLAGFFIFLSLIFFVKHRNNNVETKKYYWGAVACFMLALLSRESAVILPFILILYDITFPSKLKKLKVRLVDYLPFFLLLVLYGLMRMTVLDFSFNVGSWASQTNPYLRIITFGRVVFTYIRLLLLPLGLHMEYMPNWATTFFNPQILICNTLLLIIFASVIASYKYSRTLFFGSAWFFLTLIPFSNILPLNAVMAEHWLYIPSVGFFVVFALVVNKSAYFIKNPHVKNNFLIFVLIPIFAFYSVLTIMRNRDWKDELTLYQNVLKYSPSSARVHNNLGNIYVNIKEYENAIKEFEEAIRLKAKYFEVYNNLGIVYQLQKQYEEAIRKYEKAIEINPNYAEAYNNLAGVYALLEEYEKAISLCEKALSLGRDTPEIQNNLGAIYALQGKYEEAIIHYIKTIEMNPDHFDAYKNLGIIYNAQEKYSRAVKALTKAAKLNPRCANTHNELGLAYKNLGKYAKAVKEYETALKIDPEYFQSYNNLGVIYSIAGEYEEAIKVYKKSISINPDCPQTYKNLGIIYLNMKDYGLAEGYLKHAEELGLPVREELERLGKNRAEIQ